MFIPEKDYKNIVENTIIETIDLILLNERGQILLGLRNNEPIKGIYHIPGGRRHKKELMKDSIKRKGKEELGIELDIDKIIFLGIYDDIYPNSIFEGVDSHFSSVTYVYKISPEEEKNIQGDKQHSNMKFFDTDDQSLNELVQIRIQDMKKQNIL